MGSLTSDSRKAEISAPSSPAAACSEGSFTSLLPRADLRYCSSARTTRSCSRATRSSAVSGERSASDSRSWGRERFSSGVGGEIFASHAGAQGRVAMATATMTRLKRKYMIAMRPDMEWLSTWSRASSSGTWVKRSMVSKEGHRDRCASVRDRLVGW